MIIHQPEIRNVDDQARLTAVVEAGSVKESLWYGVEARYGTFLTTNKHDCFVVALLTTAMRRGEDMVLRGPMSEKLYYNLSNYYIPMLVALIPSLHRVQIVPTGLDSGGEHSRHGGVATGFSGGIDSFCVIADHVDAPPAFRLTHLTFHNVGNHGNRRLFEVRRDRLRKCALDMSLEFVVIDSNLTEYLSGDRVASNFVLTHVSRNVSAVLALQQLFGKYIYASTFQYQDCKVGEANDIACADPMSVHLLSTETLECMSHGCQHSRVEKTSIVTRFPLSHRYLDVCARNKLTPGNCSTCWKCARTLLTLEILDALSPYEGVFDVKAWDRIRARVIRDILLSNSPLHREIVALASARGFKFNLVDRVIAALPLHAIRRFAPKSIVDVFRRMILFPSYPD
jgi:hypothetical protein